MEKEFLEAYEQYADAIFRHCFFRLSDEEKAKDVMQDTFLKAWDYLAQGNEIRNMRAFLYRVANNLVVDSYRKKKTLSVEELQEKGAQFRHHSKDIAENRADAQRAIEICGRLKEKYRQPLLLRYVDEFSVKEIAEILGETENTVSVRLHRGIKQIQATLHHGA